MSHDGERGEGDWTGVVSDRHGHTLFWQVLKLIFSKILIHRHFTCIAFNLIAI